MVQDTAGCSAAPCSAMETCCDFASSNTNLESVSTNAIYIIPVSMTLQRAATMQA